MTRHIPLASTSGGVNDSLGGLNLAKTISESSEGLVVSVWVQSSDVNIAVAIDGVGETLVEGSHALARSEDGRNSSWNGWLLEKQCVDVNIDWDGFVRQWL